MPAYAFTALDAHGNTRKGTLEADSAKAARTQLRSQSLIPLSVESIAGSASASGAGRDGDGKQGGQGLNTVLWRSKVLNTTALAIWTRQIAGLVGSGLPLEQALSSLAQEAETEPERNLNAALRAAVNGGSTFAKALAQHPREFADI